MLSLQGVTYEKICVHHYTVESKQATMEWRRKGEIAPVNAKTRLPADDHLLGFQGCFAYRLPSTQHTIARLWVKLNLPIDKKHEIFQYKM